jgi:hypothetical protein
VKSAAAARIPGWWQERHPIGTSGSGPYNPEKRTTVRFCDRIDVATVKTAWCAAA